MNSNFSIAICIPYFGKFPDWFYVWLKSAAYNRSIDFLIFSDDLSIENACLKHPNIHFTMFSLEKINQLIKSKIHPKACLKKPYKLCDFKPTYGKLFEDYLKQYDFWGYCDIDLIFGDIRSFVTDDILENYDHIMFLGHFSINRNCERMNNLFKIKMKNKDVSYPFPFFKNTYVTVFDESQFNHICAYRNIKQYNNYDWYCDVNPDEFGFLNKRNRSVKDYFAVRWTNGRLFAYIFNEKKYVEQLYVHFQKRNIVFDENIISANDFCIFPNRAVLFGNSLDDYSKIIHNKKYVSFRKKERIKAWLQIVLIRKIQYLIYRGR